MFGILEGGEGIVPILRQAWEFIGPVAQPYPVNLRPLTELDCVLYTEEAAVNVVGCVFIGNLAIAVRDPCETYTLHTHLVYSLV
jgi:hypothetical protein